MIALNGFEQRKNGVIIKAITLQVKEAKRNKNVINLNVFNWEQVGRKKMVKFDKYSEFLTKLAIDVIIRAKRRKLNISSLKQKKKIIR